MLSFFLASSEASELFRAANAASTPSVGDVSEVGLLEVGLSCFGGDFTGVLIVWLIVTPFLTVLIGFGTKFFFEEPHRYDMFSSVCGCDDELFVEDEELAGRFVRK